MDKNNPLVTVILFTFNQESYMAEAVESVLNQTYQPLEIIISDDCSSDATFDLIKELAEKFSGPHSLRINRNTKNQGIGRHVSNIMEEANGELIILAAGDDVSLPDRAAVLVKEWIKGGFPAGIGSAVTMIDSTGVETGYREGFCGAIDLEVGDSLQIASLDAYLHDSGFGLMGCSAAWSREILDVFGRLPHDLMNEDSAFSLRALLIGKLLCVKTKLVKYRIHESNTWARDAKFKTIAERRTYEEGAMRKAGYLMSLWHSGLVDVQLALNKSIITHQQFEELTKSISASYQKAQVTKQWWTYSLARRITCFTKLSGGFGTKILKLLPFEVFLRIKSALS
jgi:glycosyltransferase involved in cell wall biosynthesis